MALIFSIISAICLVLYLIIITLEKLNIYHLKHYQKIIRFLYVAGFFLAFYAKQFIS